MVEHEPAARVVAATTAARARGVVSGQRLAGALAVAPGLQLCDRAPAQEAAVLAELANWAGRFTPSVSLDPPDGLLLEASACLRLFGGGDALARHIVASLPETGLTAQLAVAPTPLAARWLARVAPGTQIADAPRWWQQLDALPIECLGDGAPLPAAALELLRGIGIRRIGEVARLPRAGLARRHGSLLLDTLARARGERPDPRRWHTPPERFESRLELPAPAHHTEPLLFAAGRLFAGLAGWLGARQAVLDRCTLTLEHESLPATRLEIVTGRPGRDPSRLLMLAREHLSALALPSPVEALHLAAEHPLVAPGRTAGLFGDLERSRDDAQLLLGRLRARLGPSAVRTVQPASDHRPEHAWRTAEPGTRTASVPLPAGRRPLWLLPEPRLLDSVQAFTPISGPERIEGGWWSGTDIRRDYYVVAHPDSSLWWVFRQLDAPGNWYVHGFFG